MPRRRRAASPPRRASGITFCSPRSAPTSLSPTDRWQAHLSSGGDGATLLPIISFFAVALPHYLSILSQIVSFHDSLHSDPPLLAFADPYVCRSWRGMRCVQFCAGFSRECVLTFLEKLPVRKVPGIGRVLEKQLQRVLEVPSAIYP